MAVVPLLVVNEVLSVKYEVSNPYDHYAIERLPRPRGVDHTLGGGSYVAEELSVIMLHGASVAAKVITDRYKSKKGWRFLLKYQLRCMLSRINF